MNPWTTYGATLEYIPMFVMQPDIMATSCRAFLHLCTFLLSLMFSLSFPKLSILVTYFWWAYLVKNWSHQLVIFLTLNNLGKLVQTPSEGCIVFRKYNYWHCWVLNGFEKLCRNIFSPWELIINESVNTPQKQSLVQMANKTMAGILTSKTQKDIKILELVGERGRWDSFVGHKSHQDLWADCCKDLKGGEKKL